MSELPGYDLEAYVMWLHDLIVDGDGSANNSVSLAVMLGQTEEYRLRLTKEQFGKIITVYEPYREYIENLLDDFDEDRHGGWRQYSDGIKVPDDVFNLAQNYSNIFKQLVNLDI